MHILSKFTLIFCLLLLVGFGCKDKENVYTPTPEDDPQAFVELKSKAMVSDQDVTNDTITITDVSVSKDSWIVLYQNGNRKEPGKVLTSFFVAKGKHEEVRMPVPTQEAGEYHWYILIHEDAGELGMFEFPLKDLPTKTAQAMPFVARVK